MNELYVKKGAGMRYLAWIFEWLLFAVPVLLVLSKPAPIEEREYRLLSDGKPLRKEEARRALNPGRRVDLRDPSPPLE